MVACRHAKQRERKNCGLSLHRLVLQWFLRGFFKGRSRLLWMLASHFAHSKAHPGLADWLWPLLARARAKECSYLTQAEKRKMEEGKQYHCVPMTPAAIRRWILRAISGLRMCLRARTSELGSSPRIRGRGSVCILLRGLWVGGHLLENLAQRWVAKDLMGIPIHRGM